MFKVGEYIVYGTIGVCQVTQVGPISMNQGMKDRQYYTLMPVYENGSKVFTPVDNEKVVMRPIISEQEAQDLIDEIPEIETLWIPYEKGREEIYKQIIRKCECREWAKIIKTLILRRQERIVEGRKTVNADERYLKAAEDALFGELAIPLNMQRNQVEELIEHRIAEVEEKKIRL